MLPSLWWSCNQELDDADGSKVSDQGPAQSVPDAVTLRLHKQSIAFFRQLMECNFRPILVLILHVGELLLSFRFILQVRIVKLVLALAVADPQRFLLLKDPPSLL